MKESQQKYLGSRKGKAAMRRARKAYDRRDPERRRRQKREYMRRQRERNPDRWRS